jgi:GMP synthase (glutamine-hydrolysing)
MILILDFGSQYTQLIARKVREAKVFCEIHPFSMKWGDLKKLEPRGIILSGGPSSVYSKNAPWPDERIFDLGVPVLGICYGLQLAVEHFGGKVKAAAHREYGPAMLEVKPAAHSQNGRGSLFAGTPAKMPVWMSHGDAAQKLPAGFVPIARTENAPYAAVANFKRRIFGVQFHPEVQHTLHGKDILKNFIFDVCGEEPTWTMKNFVAESVREIREKTAGEPVVMALSGGVDSSVAGALVHKAIGSRLTAIFVDNGVLKLGEWERVRRIFGRRFGRRLVMVRGGERFLKKLKGVTDPEQKRKIIGREFIEIFEEHAKRIGGVRCLVQGTLYPDVIESVSVKGPSAVIKTHHNVGGLPKNMNLKLIEPLRFLFKDEARILGRELGLNDEVLNRQPFPGPGLAVRILGEVTPERIRLVQTADAIVETEIRNAGLYDKLWQAFAVLLPVKSVGVMGDDRTYENVIAVRAVTSQDAMTADWAKLPSDVLGRISNRIINEVRGVNRVVYDISSKPPATIEWE